MTRSHPSDGIGSSQEPSSQAPRRRAWLLWGLVYALLAGLFLAQSPQLYDNDSYYHLAIARAIAQDGLPDDLGAVRWSAMSEGFGDKELLFHVLLAPFASLPDPVRGGQAALALLVAGILVTVGALCAPLLGRWSPALPLLLLYGSLEVSWRLVRLRPEALALLLLLLALEAAARRRHRLLGLLAFLFALSYTAFHAFVGLFVLLFVVHGLLRRQWRPGLALWPLVGAGLGLLAHPHFPHNLRIWILQTFDFFAAKGALEVGTEIRPNTTDVALLVNLGWLLLVLWLTRSTATGSADAPAEATAKTTAPGDERGPLAAERAWSFGVATLCFGALYLLMSRFSLYAFPFATVALASLLAARGRRLGVKTSLPGGRTLPAAVALCLVLVAALPVAVNELRRYRARTDPGPDRVRLADREGLAAALPTGARVAARWQQTPIFMLWAPQATYLNVLDPIFMARPFPQRFEAQRALFDGAEPDAALTLAATLDSTHVAFSSVAPTGRLRERLEGDPRMRRDYAGIHLVYSVQPPASGAFVTDWRLVPHDLELPLPDDTDISAWRELPRAPGPLRALDVYVDLRRLPLPAGRPESETCVALAAAALGDVAEIELAPAGPTALWLGDAPIARVDGELGAVLGAGVRATLPATGGSASSQPALWQALTCGRRGGFYLRRLTDLQPSPES